MKFLDIFLADKNVKGATDDFQDAADTPFTMPELRVNKELPRNISTDKEMPKNIMDFPEVPPQAKSVTNALIADLKRIEQLRDDLAKKKEELLSVLQPKEKEISDLTQKIYARLQNVGKLISAIEPDVDLVIARLKDMFVATKTTMKSEQMGDSQKLQTVLETIKRLQPELAQQVLMELDKASQKFSEANFSISKTVRVWPIPKNRQGSINFLLAQLQADIDQILLEVEQHIGNALMGLNSIFGELEEAEGSNVTQMPSQMPLAAQRVS